MLKMFKVVARAANGATWRVCDYASLAQAERHRKLAQDWADSHESSCIGECEADNPYDAGYDHGVSPVKYQVESI